MKCFLVSHTHWDREWYRTFQVFRSRLVDAIDRVLDLVAADPGFRFLLDGQVVAVEDYLEIRPGRRAELERACRSGRVSIGPWYVQPDSLLPSGEAHVRNLLEGRRVGSSVGPVSTVAYTPDSFGHPAQFPQLFRGFGLDPFVYWRGNGDEIDELPAEYLWEAPDGSAVLVHHMGEGYFAAASLPLEPAAAAQWLENLARRLLQRTRNDCVLLMNGIDHALPDAHANAAAEVLARETGWTVKRGLLEDFAQELSRHGPAFRGELLGGRVANLLPGVWSARMPLKLRNRRAETQLEGWAEPWSALGRVLGTPDEQPSLRLAWRSLLQNQAHDSICGCSQDRVHEQMCARYDAAEELARETTARVLESIAGLGPERRTPWAEEMDVAVFNPSPHARTDVAQLALDASSWFELRGESREMALHPLLRANLTAPGFTVDGRPARLVPDTGTRRMRLLPDRPPQSVEFVVENVPAFGWRRVRLSLSENHPEREDDGREIALGTRAVSAAEDGTFTVRFGPRTYGGLCALEDVGDRGDTYDFDPVENGSWRLDGVDIRRRIHPNGIQSLAVRRVLSIPAHLTPNRERRSRRCRPLVVETETRLIPGVERVDLQVRVLNRGEDHRLRLLFPTGAPVREFHAATTFDIACRTTLPREAARWVHAASSTFPHQGFVSANGLVVVAPGLPEAEVTPDGVIAVTLVRAVGWLARMDLKSRPQPAGPLLPTPRAQCLESIEANLGLFGGLDTRAVRDVELGLRAVAAGDVTLVSPEHPLLEVAPREIVLSALKPAESGPGTILRLLNPTDAALESRVRLGFPVSLAESVRIDETPADEPVALNGGLLSMPVPAHALRTVLLK